VAFPTDTVYGLAAILNNPGAIARLYVAKARPPERAIPILLADPADLDRVAIGISATVRRLVARFWPGGLTFIVPKGLAVPDQASPGPTVAVRVPDLALARQLIVAVGQPLAATSANLSGEPNPCTADEVLAQLSGRIAAVLDGGPCPGGVPSTILDCTIEPPRLIREGAISQAELGL
jgi:L-threonylcarbamoyladenylate synthase